MSAAESSGEKASIFNRTLKLSVLRVLMVTFWCCNKTNVLHGIGSDWPPMHYGMQLLHLHQLNPWSNLLKKGCQAWWSNPKKKEADLCFWSSKHDFPRVLWIYSQCILMQSIWQKAQELGIYYLIFQIHVLYSWWYEWWQWGIHSQPICDMHCLMSAWLNSCHMIT
jgi:hypothetical protein